MQHLKAVLFIGLIAFSMSCASSYQTINPDNQSYTSGDSRANVDLQYKYVPLSKKYEKKSQKTGMKLVAIKLTNNSGRDLVFGKDLRLQFGNGLDVSMVDDELVFASLKQGVGTYLWYLLLTPLTFETTENGFQTSSTPVGLIVGPGLAGGNMLAASSANTKFKEDLLTNKIIGKTIPNGQTVSGLIGVNVLNYEALRLRID